MSQPYGPPIVNLCSNCGKLICNTKARMLCGKIVPGGTCGNGICSIPTRNPFTGQGQYEYCLCPVPF